MSAADRVIRWSTALAVLGVALVAAVVSYDIATLRAGKQQRRIPPPSQLGTRVPAIHCCHNLKFATRTQKTPPSLRLARLCGKRSIYNTYDLPAELREP
jgi:hypothetical protein